MALSINSISIFRAIADHPEAFPTVQADLNEAARKLLVKQLKATAIDATLFKTIYRVIGEKNISIILDGYGKNELVTLIKKIDPFTPHLKASGDLELLRSHIADIATDRVQPSDKPQKATTTKTTKSSRKEPLPKIGGILESKVHSGKARSSRQKKVTGLLG